ncbi:ATP-binding protein [Acinetobacter indicus]|uniref:ATP-binding protein n=1 Tax=Acinetobacter indicus TaxID=756892 RepID=UPI000CEBB569|nr:ATP-binding protein [Acinetobacter indicus]
MQNYSLKWRLVSMFMVVFLSLWSLVFCWLYYDLQQRLQDTLDQRLFASAQMVARLIQHLPLQEINPDSLKQVAEQYHAQNLIACEVSVFSSDITLGPYVVARTRGAPAQLTGQQPGFSTWQENGVEWRSYVLRKGDIQVVAAERLVLRASLLQQILQSVLIPLVLSLLICMALVIHILRKEFHPLDDMAQQLADKQHSLSDAAHYLQHLDARKIPKEVQPFVDNSNQLIQNLHHSLENEKLFTAYAAHELRSPLTAIKTHVQLSRMMVEQNPAQASKLIENLKQAENSIWRYHQLLEQLLLLSQTDHDTEQAATDSETTEVAPVLRQVIEELGPVYPHLNSILQVDWESLQTLQLPPLSLQTILKNLLENALLHAQGLSRIEIVMHDQQLLVQDDGQGLTAAELTQMTRRFWRKSAQQQGHGLGLALVKALLQHHHYQMDLSLNPPQGLSIRIRPEQPSSTPN